MNTKAFAEHVLALKEDIFSYFNVKNDLESQQDIELSIRSGVSFRGSNLLTLIFAILVASLGLNTNSIPVIIGAMLISPLMGPIIGIGLGIAVKDFDLVRRSFKNISAAVIGSLAASALYFLISPQYEGSSQLLARTSPSIYDVFVALFGGAAGILSIASKNKGQVMPGVAIATSLMPPLCTAGYGIATMQMHFFLGALYLFFTNMIFILCATWIGVKMIGLKQRVYQDDKRAKRVKALMYVIIAGTITVSVYLTVVMIQKNRFLDMASQFIETEMVFPNTQVLTHKEYVSGGKKYIDVTLIGEALPKDSLQLAMMNKLDSVGLGGTILNIKQGFSMSNANEFENSDKFYKLMQNEIASNQNVIDSLQNVIRLHEEFSDDGVRVAPEVKVLFPTIKDIAMSQMLASAVGKQLSDTVNMVFVNAPTKFSLEQQKKLTEYLGVRLKRKNIHLILNPAGFPWPSSKPEKQNREEKQAPNH
ncbi:MAG: TIGR00341 family protein [Candidatus Amulumruptor caecigallinarius]|nr:TIGR00341 family protein [Candidatus Amulumruptor caecigallinarius]